MPKSQEQIKQGLQNQMNLQGIYVVEKEAEYEGKDVVVYVVMPTSLAIHADDIVAQLLPDINEEHSESEPEDETTELDESPKDSELTKKKTAIKKATPPKKLAKKGKK